MKSGVLVAFKVKPTLVNFSQTTDKVRLSPFSLILQDGLSFGLLHRTTNRSNPDSSVARDG